MKPSPWSYDGTAVLCEHHAAPGGGFSYPLGPSHPLRGEASPEAYSSRYETLHLGSLDRIIDRLHELFDHWEVQHIFPPSITREMLSRARLVIHEWVANLVQHADFDTLVPEIAMSVWVEEQALCCVVMDNSSGFELAPPPVLTLEEVCLTLPERGMGLLMLYSCADDVDYRRLSNENNRLEFTITP